MKKVLMITYDSPNIDRRIYLFADALLEVGYDVSILTIYADKERGFEHIDVVNLIEKKDPRAIVSPSFLKEKLRRILPYKIFNVIRKIYRRFFIKNGYMLNLNEMIQKASSIKADFYVANDLPTLPIAKACIDKNGGKFIYDAHEFFLGQDTISQKQKEILDRVESKIYPEIDLLITVNDDIEKLFIQKYGIKKSQIILNATKSIVQEKKYLHDLIRIDRNEKIILYQGGFIEKRNLEDIVIMSQYLKNCVVVLLGWGSIESDLKKLAQKLLVLNKKIFFVAKISQLELISYTSSATLGIIPYRGYDLNTKYCTPNKLFEFIAAGLPFLYNNDLHTVRNFVELHKIGMPINISDHENSATKIDSLVYDYDAILNLRKNMINTQKIINWDNEKIKIVNAFRAISE